MKKMFFLILALTLANANTNAQTYFRVEQEYPDGYNGQYSIDLGTLKTYSDDSVKIAFKTIVNSGMYFNYPQGGCQNRAEMMHIILEKQLHMQHSKIWIFAPRDLYLKDNRYLEIPDPNGNAINNVIKWGYHVAPAILRKNKNDKTDTLVIDPAIDRNKAMLLKDWLKAMNNSNVSKYTFLDSKWYFFYTKENGNSPIINGFFYPYASHWVVDFHRSLMERGLAVNDLARYLMQKMKDGYNDSDGSVKWLLANQDVIYDLFMNPYKFYNNDSDNKKTNLLKNHSALMRNAEQYYWERLAFWQAEANRLLELQ
jgi:hypothetical protein